MRLSLREGIILASVPVIGTTPALIYKSGSLSFFRVPLSIATLDISHIVRVTLLRRSVEVITWAVENARMHREAA
mgnify:CR=1 FL=1